MVATNTFRGAQSRPRGAAGQGTWRKQLRQGGRSPGRYRGGAVVGTRTHCHTHPAAPHRKEQNTQLKGLQSGGRRPECTALRVEATRLAQATTRGPFFARERQAGLRPPGLRSAFCVSLLSECVANAPKTWVVVPFGVGLFIRVDPPIAGCWKYMRFCRAREARNPPELLELVAEKFFVNRSPDHRNRDSSH
jgi:hypothetical protein